MRLGSSKMGVGGGGGEWSLVNVIFTTLSVTVVLLNCGSSNVDAAAVMSVDLGSEWVKIGIVSVSKIDSIQKEIVLKY